jgi:hypothetical protein
MRSHDHRSRGSAASSRRASCLNARSRKTALGSWLRRTELASYERTAGRPSVTHDVVDWTGSRRLAWQELRSAPALPGIYAWYFQPSLTRFDLDVLLELLAETADAGKKARAVQQFLKKHVLRHFEESPYQMQMTGALKATYSGTVSQHQSISSSLLERIVDDPMRLEALRRTLAYVAPEFMAPLYIGMAKRLQDRLSTHKTLIERLLEARPPLSSLAVSGETRDHSFALEVYRRELPTSALFVTILVTPDLGDIAVDAENLLNRINFPILGRN